MSLIDEHNVNIELPVDIWFAHAKPELDRESFLVTNYLGAGYTLNASPRPVVIVKSGCVLFIISAGAARVAQSSSHKRCVILYIAGFGGRGLRRVLVQMAVNGTAKQLDQVASNTCAVVCSLQPMSYVR